MTSVKSAFGMRERSHKGGRIHPKKALNITSHEYAEAATVHGISYACNSHNKVLPRIAWSLIVLILGKKVKKQLNCSLEVRLRLLTTCIALNMI